MQTLLKPLQVREILLEKGVRTFTPYDFERIFQVSSTKTKYFIETQTSEGLFSRLKQGLYALKTDMPSEEEIANRLYRPSYISFDYALAYYGMIPEMPYTVTSATTKPTRQFNVDHLTFAYFTIKEEAYTGYSLIRTNSPISEKSNNTYNTELSDRIGNFFIADPEKALADYLYFVSIGKREYNDRISKEKVGSELSLDKKKLQAYAKLYDRKRLTELLREFL